MLRKLLNRNLLILFGCQTIFVSGTVVLITVGGIIGHLLAPDPSLATLPVALMVVGTALTTIPAALTMQAIGRRYGFMVGAFVAFTGAWLVSQALAEQSFPVFCLGTILMGSSLGFSQQFRFAAAESVPTEVVSHAISFILLGSIAGAFAAPAIIGYSVGQSADAPYAAAFPVVMGLTLISYAVNLFLFAMGRLQGGASSVIGQGSRYVDPLPQALVLTAIVIGFAMTAFVVVLALRSVGELSTDHVDGREQHR